MTMENISAPFLYYLKLYADMLNSSKSTIFVLCDFEIWQMTLKGYRAPLHTTSNFVHHFQAIDEFKLELQFKIEDFLVPCDL